MKDFLNHHMARLTPERSSKVEAIAKEIITANGIARLREKVGMTQSELASRLDIKQAAVSQVENGDPRLSTLRRYIEALGGQIEIHVTFPNKGQAANLVV